jgi:hypothetical protein
LITASNVDLMARRLQAVATDATASLSSMRALGHPEVLGAAEELADLLGIDVGSDVQSFAAWPKGDFLRLHLQITARGAFEERTYRTRVEATYPHSRGENHQPRRHADADCE